MTAGTFRALRFSKFTGTTERFGAAHFADFRIPFWIDATDGGPGNYGGQDGKQATSRPCRIPSQRLRELIEASSRRRVTLAGKLRIYADRKAEPLIRSRLSCTS